MLSCGAPRRVDKLSTTALSLEVQSEYVKVKTAVEEVQMTRVKRGCERSTQTRTEVALSSVLSQASPSSPKASSTRQKTTEAEGSAAAASTDPSTGHNRSVIGGTNYIKLDHYRRQRASQTHQKKM